MKFSERLRQYEIIGINWNGPQLLGKSRGLKKGPIDIWWCELNVPDKKTTCKRQRQKSRQHNDHVNKWMEWKEAASIHGRMELEIARNTIRWTHTDNRNTGCQNADDDKKKEIFFGDIHKWWPIVPTVFWGVFRTPVFVPIPTIDTVSDRGIQFSKASRLYLHCGIKSSILFHSPI